MRTISEMERLELSLGGLDRAYFWKGGRGLSLNGIWDRGLGESRGKSSAENGWLMVVGEGDSVSGS